uniref:SecA family profile domain-containing protein n=1 Tax=Glossina morsitans morsitans TaxID=37546 RepID=A0A1B0FJ77_GLOMM
MGDRITKADLIGHINKAEQPAIKQYELPKSVVSGEQREERVKMSKIRQVIAIRLKASQNTAAILTTFNEIDMKNVIDLRTKYKDAFEKKYGIKLGFMSAAVQALKEIPEINTEISGDEIIYKHYYDIGVTVGTDKGLVVPIMRSADQMLFTEIELTLVAFDKKAREDMVQRGFHSGIVDEVDSIIIDEARTPLIISGPVEENYQIYKHIIKIVTKLFDYDYEVDGKGRTVFLTEDGISQVEELLRSYNLIPENSSLYDTDSMIMTYYIDQALRAHKLFNADKDCIVKDGKVVIIDEFTGRMMEGRRYSDGFHQALEAKEHLEIQYENQTLASLTFQNSGMTGTAATEAEEFHDIYRLNVVKIPTNVPVKTIDIDDVRYRKGKI